MQREINIRIREGGEQSGILYLTDELDELRRLQEKGKIVAAVLTENNREMDFSQIPYALERIEELEEEDFERIYRRLAQLPLYILETRRCRLREMTERDLDRLYEIYAAPALTEYTEGLYEDRERELAYLRDYRKYVYEFYDCGIWLVEEKESGEIIGRAGVEPCEDRMELGFVIALPWQRQGYAYEVCREIIRYVKERLGITALTARVHQENIASVRLLEKLGFSSAGQRDAAGLCYYEHFQTERGCPENGGEDEGQHCL